MCGSSIPHWMPSPETLGGALGLQGVRLFEVEPIRSVIEAQLAALDALTDEFDIRILIPYLVRYE